MAEKLRMPDLDFRLATRSYLDEYLEVDKPCHDALNAAEKDQKQCCAILQYTAGVYQISRTLPKNGEGRYFSAVFRILVGESKPNELNLVAAVERVAISLGAAYPHKDGPRRPISTASKLLWMKFKRPVVIRDALATAWLNSENKPEDGSYAAYVRAWRDSFAKYAPQILAESVPIISAKSFTRAASMSDEQLEEIIVSDWFQERIFDHAIVASAAEHALQTARCE